MFRSSFAVAKKTIDFPDFSFFSLKKTRPFSHCLSFFSLQNGTFFHFSNFFAFFWPSEKPQPGSTGAQLAFGPRLGRTLAAPLSAARGEEGGQGAGAVDCNRVAWAAFVFFFVVYVLLFCIVFVF